MVSSGAGSVTHCPLLWMVDVSRAAGGGGRLPKAPTGTWRETARHKVSGQCQGPGVAVWPTPARHGGGTPLVSPILPGFRVPRTHRLQVVPCASGEVASHFDLPGLEHGGDEQSLPPQELAVHGPGAGVLGEPAGTEGRACGPGDLRGALGEDQGARGLRVGRGGFLPSLPEARLLEGDPGLTDQLQLSRVGDTGCRWCCWRPR